MAKIIPSLLVGSLLCCSAVFAETSRHFQAEIVAVDPAKQTLHLRHKPTGYEVDVAWNKDTKFTSYQESDLDEFPEGWASFWCAEVDPAKHIIAGISRVESLDSAPDHADTPAAKTLFKARLLREPLNDNKLPEGSVKTLKGDAVYILDINGEKWNIIGKSQKKSHVRPKLQKIHDLSPSDLKPGQGLRDVSYVESPSGNHLVSAQVLLAPFKPHAIGRGTGTTTAIIAQEMDRLREAHAKVAGEIRKLAPVTMKVEPEIALPGEPITVVLQAWADKSPNPDLLLTTNYLQPDAKSAKTLKLDWKPGTKEDGLTQYQARLTLPPLSVGQHWIQWNCDIGGDISEFWRSFAVADKDTLVLMLHFSTGVPNAEFEEFRLPYDYWEESAMRLLGGPLGSRRLPNSAAAWLEDSKEYRRRGAAPGTHIIQGNYAGRTGWPAPIPVQFYEEPRDVKQAVVKAAVELMPMLGFRADEIGITAYELDTESVNVAHENGVNLITSLCIQQNYQDGSWGINHLARPLRPYFSARDDFRKAGPGGSDGMMMISQQDKSLLWTEYGLGVFEPTWLDRAWVGGGAGGRTTIDDIYMSRHYDLIEASQENIVNQHVPYFASIGIEFSRKDPDELSTKSNALMIRYVVNQAAKGKIVFCNEVAAADFYRRHYKETPETVFYDADFWCGTKSFESITSSWKPLSYPDLMQIENAGYSAFFKRPVVLPEYHWDYTVPWKYPTWGNENLPRNQAGILVPGEHDKFAVTPKTTDTRGLKVTEDRQEKNGSLEVVLHVESDRELKAFPLAVWDIPREWKSGGGWWKTSGANRFVPIQAPFTKNLNGILEADLKPGKNEIHLTINSPKRELQSQDVKIGLLRAKVFDRNGQSMAYVWAQQPWETEFELQVPPGKQAKYYAAPEGKEVDLAPGTHRLKIGQESWSRIIGLTKNELESALHEIKQVNQAKR